MNKPATSHRGLLLLLLAAALAAALIACAPIVRQADNGDWSFARQVFPILYGRKARGYDELKVVADMERLFGRETTLRAMMKRPEFVDHWSEVLVNHMQASKEVPNADVQSQRACFPQAATAAGNSAALARWIRDHGPEAGPAQCDGVPCGSFTMTDVVRSSLMLDDLSPAYRAYLFAMQARPISGNQTTEANRRASVHRRFESVFLHRRNECLGCHNSFSSTTGPSSYWNRLFALPSYLEEAVYGGHAGRSDARELHAMFRVGGVNGGSVSPWGMSSDCGSFRRPTTDDNDPGAAAFGYFTRSFGKRGSIFDIESQLASGVSSLGDGLARCAASVSSTGATCTGCTSNVEPPLSAAQQSAENAVRTLFNSKNCFSSGCHGGGAGTLTMVAATFKNGLVRIPSAGDSAKARVAPGCADGTEAGCGGRRSHLMERLTTSDPSRRMPPGGALTASEITTVRTWINGLPTNAGCASSVCTATAASCANYAFANPYVAGNEGFAYMTAVSLTNAVWTQVMGQPLTIDLYHPRNEGQRNVLWNLAEFNFAEKAWSLRELLVHILMYDYFNRKPPVTGEPPSAYELPQFLNPWTEGDPRQPPIAAAPWHAGDPAPSPAPGYDRNAEANRPRHYDPMTEAIHRHGARTLLNSAASALDWTRPDRFYSSPYPGQPLALAMGEYWKDVEPGFRGTNLSSLLNWEFTHGTCARPAGVTTDWIDRLTGAVPAFDTANPSAPVLVEDVARTVKDWLVNYSQLDGGTPVGGTVGEQQAIEAVYGVPLSTPAAGVADLPTRTRRYCGMLLQSPQFMLAGLEPPAGTALPPRPRLRVCNGGSCNYRDICGEYLGSLAFMVFRRVVCLDGGMTTLDLPEFDFAEWAIPIGLLCGRKFCEVIQLPPRCIPGRPGCGVPPPCDPRIDGCGGPLPPIELAHQLSQGKVLVLPQDDERLPALQRGGGVLHLRNEKPLERGTPAQAGDWLMFPAGSTVRLGWFDSAPAPRPLRPEGQSGREHTLTILVAAPAAQRFEAARLPAFAPPLDEIREQLQSPERRFGSGGLPLDPAMNRFDPKELDARKRFQEEMQQRRQRPPGQ